MGDPKQSVDGKAPDQVAEKGDVPREKYEELLRKYEELQKQVSQSKPVTLHTENQVDEIVGKLGQVPLTKGEEIAPGIAIDTFDSPTSTAGLSSEVDLVQKAIFKFEIGQYTEANKIFTVLLHSPFEQVRVRAKFYTAKILMLDQKYQESLHIFDSIIAEDSFSSYSLDTLKEAVFCAEKLGLTEKKSNYEALLRGSFKYN